MKSICRIFYLHTASNDWRNSALRMSLSLWIFCGMRLLRSYFQTFGSSGILGLYEWKYNRTSGITFKLRQFDCSYNKNSGWEGNFYE